MNKLFKKLAARLPHYTQQQLKRLYFSRQISAGRFFTDEKEYALLDSMVRPGDWVVDVGANIGHYTARLSALVGPSGRVIAFEPVPATFELLASNVSRFRYANVTLINAAASDHTRAVGMSLPRFDTGLTNFYMARLGEDVNDLDVLALPVDAFGLPRPVRLVKIDAEGHEMSVLGGMAELLARDHPDLIIEENSPQIAPHLIGLGYRVSRLADSSNAIYRWSGRPDASSIP